MTLFEIPTSGIIVTGSYNMGLVILSYIITVFASYTALDLAVRIKDSSKRTRKFWVGGCALVMGCGIWSMHFTAMLAFQLPVEVSYHIPMTLLSLVLAVIASGYGLFYCNTPPILPRKIVGGGIAMGIGVVGMHYSGMAAMQMNATMYFTPLLFILSVVIAIGAASAALWLLVHGNKIFRKIKGSKVISSLIMGVAVFGMHFTGMAASNYVVNEQVLKDSLISTDASWLALGIGIFTLVTLGITIIASFIQRLARQDARTQAILDGVVDGIVTINDKGNIISFNRAAERIFGYLESELIGENVKLLMPNPYREEHDHYIQNYLSTGLGKIIGVGREVVGLRKGGKLFHCIFP
jgi:PAS domain S-box-containing protein